MKITQNIKLKEIRNFTPQELPSFHELTLNFRARLVRKIKELSCFKSHLANECLKHLSEFPSPREYENHPLSHAFIKIRKSAKKNK